MEEVPEHYYIEKRYCTICNIEQPIRSKHCKDCQRCVAMYDHHCPWMGFKDFFKYKDFIKLIRNLHWRKEPFNLPCFSIFPIS